MWLTDMENKGLDQRKYDTLKTMQMSEQTSVTFAVTLNSLKYIKLEFQNWGKETNFLKWSNNVWIFFKVDKNYTDLRISIFSRGKNTKETTKALHSQIAEKHQKEKILSHIFKITEETQRRLPTWQCEEFCGHGPQWESDEYWSVLVAQLCPTL